MSNPEYGKIPVSTSSWHAKLFNFGQDLWCNFLDKSGWDCVYYKRNVDLCQYIRTILVKFPLVMLAIAATYGVLIYTFIVFPFSYLPAAYLHFLMIVGIVAICAAFLVCVIRFAYNIHERKKEERLRKLNEQSLEEWKAAMEERRNRPPSFFKICCQWIKDRHDRFCRLLEFKE